jgi:hypothetical protein
MPVCSAESKTMTLWHISFHKNVHKFQATLVHAGKIYHIGYFAHKADAIVAQNSALTTVYGSLGAAWVAGRPKRRSRGSARVEKTGQLAQLIRTQSGPVLVNTTDKTIPARSVVVVTSDPPAKPTPVVDASLIDDYSLLNQFEELRANGTLEDLL